MLCQPSGRERDQDPFGSGLNILELLPGQTDFGVSRTSSGEIQLGGRLAFLALKGCQSLETTYTSVSTDSGQVGSLHDRSVCLSAELSAEQIL